MIGRILNNRYKIDKKIALGGMSIVYKAKDQVLNRDVAIKVLKEEHTTDEDFLEKFKQEPLSVAALNCPNIVNVYDTGVDDGIYFLVMEYIDGMDLKEYLKQHGRLSEQEALNFSIQIATALKHAHENNVIHRDIKPQNIMINRNRVAKLTDFGIAKGASTSTINGTKDVIGSVHYLSPEQARGGYIDDKSDIYSLGVVMYEMITGLVPFDGENYVTVAMAHLNAEILPPSEKVDNLKISKGFERVIMKCLQKHQSYRYQNANRLLQDLTLLSVNKEPTIIEVDRNFDDSKYSTVVVKREDMNKMDRENNMKNDKEKAFDDFFSKTDDINKEDRTKIVVENKTSKFDKITKKTKINSNKEVSKKKIDKKDISKKDKPKNTDDKGKNFIHGMMGFFAALIIAVVGGYLLISSLFIPKEVEVPQLIGLTELKAKEALEGKNLLIKVNRRIFDAEYEEGTVISQSVDDGRDVQEKSIIGVTISKGVEQVAVPDIIGKYSVEAEALLKTKGLSFGEKKYEFSSQYTKGMIIEQAPGEDTQIETGQTVDVVLSKGKEIVYTEVPDLLSLDLNTAKNLLSSKSLRVRVHEDYSDEVLEGRIISQNYRAYSSVEEGTYITITVSLGVDPEKVEEDTNTDDTNADENAEEETSGEDAENPSENIEEDNSVKKSQLNIPLSKDNETADVKIYDVTDGSERLVYDKVVDTAQGSLIVSVEGRGIKKYKIYVGNTVLVDADGNEFVTVTFQ